MKTLFIFKSIDLDMTARFEDSTDLLSINGTWKQQEFGMSIPAKIEQQTTPFEKLLDLAEKAQTSAEVVVIELSDYEKNLIELHEVCRKGKVTIDRLAVELRRIAHIHGKLPMSVIADLFAC